MNDTACVAVYEDVINDHVYTIIFRTMRVEVERLFGTYNNEVSHNALVS